MPISIFIGDRACIGVVRRVNVNTRDLVTIMALKKGQSVEVLAHDAETIRDELLTDCCECFDESISETRREVARVHDEKRIRAQKPWGQRRSVPWCRQVSVDLVDRK